MGRNTSLQYICHDNTLSICTDTIVPVGKEYYRAEMQCDTCPLHRSYQEERAARAYWQTMHKRATEREQKLKAEIEELKATLRLRERQLFAAKTEKYSNRDVIEVKESDNTRIRGQQPGNPGHGRRNHRGLPVKEEVCELPDNERHCPQCGLRYHEMDSTEDSEEIAIAVSAHIRRMKRKKYIRGCQCEHVPVIMTAPPPAKLIPKGVLGISVWVLVMIDKYLSYRPTYRLLEQLRLYGIDISQGTVTDGLKRLAPLFEPVIQGIEEKNITEDRWHADETHWLVFQTVEGKVGYRWYMWVFISKSTVIYKLDKSRSSKVPRQHFEKAVVGILNVDRYAAYKVLLKEGKLLIAFCWAHVRRDFICVLKDWSQCEEWAKQWIGSIGNLYYLNEVRLSRGDNTQEYADADAQLRAAVTHMEQEVKDQLAQSNLHPACRKPLKSLKRHWKGLTLFIDYPEVPMDNNEAERRERGPVVGRKNYYGSGALWSGQLAATMFSIVQTLVLHNINPHLWLMSYLEACANNGGKAPEDITSFLPWNMTDALKRAFALRDEIDDSS